MSGTVTHRREAGQQVGALAAARAAAARPAVMPPVVPSGPDADADLKHDDPS